VAIKKGYPMSQFDGIDGAELESDVELNPEDGTSDEGDTGEPGDDS
jgi:hypothetical protein